MSEEFDNDNATTPFSSFVPLAILLAGLVLFFGYQDFEVNNQRAAYSQQLQVAAPTIAAAQNWQARYNAMMKDLVQSSAKDQAIAAIAKEAVQAGVQAGLIRVNQQAPAAGTPAAETSGTTTPSTPAK